MLFNRRSVFFGALLPLVPATIAGDQDLLTLGVQLEVLQRRVMVLRQAGLESAGWVKWNEAVVESVALAERIGRTPADDVAGFAIKLKALACEWEDDLEDHQLRRLRDLAREMAGARRTGGDRSGSGCA